MHSERGEAMGMAMRGDTLWITRLIRRDKDRHSGQSDARDIAEGSISASVAQITLTMK